MTKTLTIPDALYPSFSNWTCNLIPVHVPVCAGYEWEDGVHPTVDYPKSRCMHWWDLPTSIWGSDRFYEVNSKNELCLNVRGTVGRQYRALYPSGVLPFIGEEFELPARSAVIGKSFGLMRGRVLDAVIFRYGQLSHDQVYCLMDGMDSDNRKFWEFYYPDEDQQNVWMWLLMVARLP